MGGQADLGIADGFFDGFQVAGAEGFDEDLGSFGDADGGDGAEIGQGAVVFDLDMLNEPGVGAAGADAAELVEEVVGGLFHVHFGFEKYVVEWHEEYVSSNGEFLHHLKGMRMMSVK